MSTILIVEDESFLRQALSTKLAKEGFDVLTAQNGVEGLQQAYGNKPDLILLDIIMPKMDGIRMMEELRKDRWGKNVPVIILSNVGDPDTIDPGIRQKANAYIVKSDSSIASIVDVINQELSLF